MTVTLAVWSRRCRRLALAACLGTAVATHVGAAPPAVSPSPPAQQTFATPDEAAAALAKAARAHDARAILSVLGPHADKLVHSGDRVADQNAADRFADAYESAHTISLAAPDRATLAVGPGAWPLPIPIVREAAGWRFDARQGAEEIIDRRIGRNELLTIRTLLALVAAEQDFFDRVKRGTGAGEYTTRVLSTPGTEDGLYWPVKAGEPASPLGPLVDEAADEGYPTEPASEGAQQRPYHGYVFRVVTAQGPHAPGGAKDYVTDGELTGGFAIIAWPAEHAVSGVMTFQVDQDGTVFQKDLGPDTARLASRMTRFDPDETWTRVDLAD